MKNTAPFHEVVRGHELPDVFLPWECSLEIWRLLVASFFGFRILSGFRLWFLPDGLWVIVVSGEWKGHSLSVCCIPSTKSSPQPSEAETSHPHFKMRPRFRGTLHSLPKVTQEWGEAGSEPSWVGLLRLIHSVVSSGPAFSFLLSVVWRGLICYWGT